ncbi:MAG: ABC transporter substrate-binding protein [Chloroflexi bacterium]|nr:ABC transporter substrate-binding protein [Chloroflexota bacterium]
MSASFRSSFFLAIPLLALALLAAACGGGEDATPTPAPAPRPAATSVPVPAATPTSAPVQVVGLLRVAVASFGREIVTPSRSSIGEAGVYGAPMFDWMVWANEQGEVAPGVIERWEMAADGLSWTLQVRSGMKFHNGDALTVEDVKFSYEQMVRQEAISTNAALFKNLFDSATASSPTSVQVKTKRPWPLMHYDISMRAGPEGVVVPKGYTQQVGDKGFEDKPVGTGPWKLVAHQTGDYYSFEAVTAPHPFRLTPRYRYLDILRVPEESTRVAMLRTNAAEIIQIGFDQAKALGRDQSVKVINVPGIVMGVLHLYGWGDERTQGKPLGSKDVRQALVKAVNTKEMLDTLFGGLAQPAARWLIQPGMLGWNDAWKPEPYDPAGARDLLAKGGFARGFSFDIMSFSAPPAPWLPQMVEAVAGYWSQIGVQPKILPTDLLTWNSKMRARPQAADLVGNAAPIYGGSSPNPIPFLRSVYHREGTLLLLKSPQVDSWLDEASATLDAQRRVELIRKVVDFAYTEYVALPVAITPDLYAATARIGSWRAIRASGIGAFAETLRPGQ